ncbi:MAG TPA: hypothetical protein VFN10_02350 [Thermoanaerobaculia bacterium]|nr:hypothetical protein [Thermoanaerobaculia bacterium]
MPILDVYLGDNERRRKRRRGKWVIPLVIGIGSAIVLTRTTPAPPRTTVPPPRLAVAQPQLPPLVIPTQTQTSTQTSSPPQPAPLPATAAHIVVTPPRLDFGDGAFARAVPAQLATIRNDGGTPIDRVDVVADAPFLATSGCEGALPPGAQCSIAVVLPTKQPGKFSGALKIAAGNESARIALRGGTQPPPRVVAAPPPLVQTPAPVVTAAPPPPVAITPKLPPARTLCFQPAFLRFVTTGKQTITLTNPEPTPLRVVAVLPIGRQGQTVSGYEIESKRCLRVLKPRQQCRFTVRANELALRMQETMQLTVYYEDPLTGGTRAAHFDSSCGQ